LNKKKSCRHVIKAKTIRVLGLKHFTSAETQQLALRFLQRQGQGAEAA
jgi:hypothetical protein